MTNEKFKITFVGSVKRIDSIITLSQAKEIINSMKWGDVYFASNISKWRLLNAMCFIYGDIDDCPIFCLDSTCPETNKFGAMFVRL